MRDIRDQRLHTRPILGKSRGGRAACVQIPLEPASTADRRLSSKCVGTNAPHTASTSMRSRAVHGAAQAQPVVNKHGQRQQHGGQSDILRVSTAQLYPNTPYTVLMGAFFAQLAPQPTDRDRQRVLTST